MSTRFISAYKTHPGRIALWAIVRCKSAITVHCIDRHGLAAGAHRPGFDQCRTVGNGAVGRNRVAAGTFPSSDQSLQLIKNRTRRRLCGWGSEYGTGKKYAENDAKSLHFFDTYKVARLLWAD